MYKYIFIFLYTLWVYVFKVVNSLRLYSLRACMYNFKLYLMSNTHTYMYKRV